MKRFGRWYVKSIRDWVTAKSIKAVFKGYFLAYITAVLTLGPFWYYFPHYEWFPIVWAVTYIIFVFSIAWSEL